MLIPLKPSTLVDLKFIPHKWAIAWNKSCQKRVSRNNAGSQFKQYSEGGMHCCRTVPVAYLVYTSGGMKIHLSVPRHHRLNETHRNGHEVDKTTGKCMSIHHEILSDIFSCIRGRVEVPCSSCPSNFFRIAAFFAIDYRIL